MGEMLASGRVGDVTWALESLYLGPLGIGEVVGPTPSLHGRTSWLTNRGDPIYLITNWEWSSKSWVLNQKYGKTPKSSILIGFSMKKTIHFEGFPTICGNTQVDLYVSAVTGQGR